MGVHFFGQCRAGDDIAALIFEGLCQMTGPSPFFGGDCTCGIYDDMKWAATAGVGTESASDE